METYLNWAAAEKSPAKTDKETFSRCHIERFHTVRDIKFDIREHTLHSPKKNTFWSYMIYDIRNENANNNANNNMNE